MGYVGRDAQRLRTALESGPSNGPGTHGCGSTAGETSTWMAGAATHGSAPSQAETFLMSYRLGAADALQLAAAWTWCSGSPQDYVFISGDAQLLEAARQVGFQIVTA